jgi:hypothetical protein
MKGFTFGLTRRVEEHWIDVSKSKNVQESRIKDRFPLAIDDSPDGLYTSVIVPEYLKGRRILIIPVDEENTVMTLEECMEGMK